MKKAVKAILNVLSYGGIEVESARRLADIKKLDPIRIFLRKLDMEIYNGDYKVPIRLFFPDEKMEEHGAKEAILFFHGGGWTTESVETYDRVCARMAQSTGQIVVSVEYRLAPEHRFPTGLEDCYAAAQAMLRGEILPEVTPENVTIMGDSAGGNLAAAVCLMARDKKELLPGKQILIYPGGEFLLHREITVQIRENQWNRIPSDQCQNGRLCNSVSADRRRPQKSVLCTGTGRKSAGTAGHAGTDGAVRSAAR